jgi:ribosomal-protein-serine acetyltransferase
VTRPDLDLDLGDGVRLRSLALDDAEMVYEVVDANRERLDRWFPWVESSRGAEAQRTWIASAIADDRSAEANGIFVDGVFAGSVGLAAEPRSLGDGGDIGYWLAEGFEGRGLITKACAALMDVGFSDRGLHRIQIRAAPGNVRSRAVCERLGLREEGILRGAGRVGGGVYLDLVIYAVLADDWASREP